MGADSEDVKMLCSGLNCIPGLCSKGEGDKEAMRVFLVLKLLLHRPPEEHPHPSESFDAWEGVNPAGVPQRV